MNRIKSLKKISKKKIWDLVIIGGGSSGLGSLSILLVEDTKHY